MKQNKRKKAELLLDTIGDIDDRFLTEAMAWCSTAAAAQPRRRPIRVLLIAATVAVALMLSLVGAVVLFLRRGETPPPQPDTPPVLDEVQTLNGLLQDCTESTSFVKRTAEEINFFDGTVRLTLQELSTGTLYVSRPLTSSEQSVLVREMTAQKERATTGADASYLVWITLGNGDVLSPYLAHTAGNVGAANLFAYKAEYIPTQAFNQLLEGLI